MHSSPPVHRKFPSPTWAKSILLERKQLFWRIFLEWHHQERPPIHTETESIDPPRSQRIANAVRIIFTILVTDIATAHAATEIAGALSGVNSALSARAVDNILSNAANLIGAPVSEQHNSQLSLDRARSSMIIKALSDTSYALNFPSGTHLACHGVFHPLVHLFTHSVVCPQYNLYPSSYFPVHCYEYPERINRRRGTRQGGQNFSHTGLCGEE